MIKISSIVSKLINGGKLFGVLIAIIKEVIQAVEVPGHGEEKKKAVKDVAREFWVAVDQKYHLPLPDWKTIEPVVDTTTDLIVKVYNLAGKLSAKEG